MDESHERFKVQQEYVRQRRAEDEARFKAIEEMVHQQYRERRESSAEKNIQVGHDSAIQKLEPVPAEEDEPEAATTQAAKAAAYKEMLKRASQAVEGDKDVGRKSMFTEKLLKLLYAM